MTSKKIFTRSIYSLSLLAIVAIAPNFASASVSCNFDRDLDIGAEGEDVRCLQKYLNSAGFTISTSGVGSPGKETTQYKDLTKAAVVLWQKTNGLPDSGFFGPKSRDTYSKLVSGAPTPTTPAGGKTAEQIRAEIEALKNQVLAEASHSSSNSNSASTGNKKSVENLIVKAMNEIDDAREQIQDAVNDGTATKSAQKNLDDALDDLFDAIKSYFTGDYDEATATLNDSMENADDALVDAGGESEENRLNELLNDIEDRIDEAENTIEEAEDDDKEVDEAWDLLEEAKSKVDEADKALDDRDFDLADDLADDADDLVEDAIDAIDENSDKEGAKDAINDAKDAIEEAQDAIDEAKDDDEDTDDAEDLLDEAEDLLSDAEEAYDDEDYSEAEDLADDAKEAAEDAQDEL